MISSIEEINKDNVLDILHNIQDYIAVSVHYIIHESKHHEKVYEYIGSDIRSYIKVPLIGDEEIVKVAFGAYDYVNRVKRLLNVMVQVMNMSEHELLKDIQDA